MNKKHKERYKAPTNTFLDSIIRPLHYLKCKDDVRYNGLRMDDSQPNFLKFSELMPADVFFCPRNKKYEHNVISRGSSGEYVHAAIYIGEGMVVESTRKGVVKDTLSNFINRYPYIVVCSCPGVQGIPDLREKVVEFCEKHVTLKTPYSIWSATKAPLYELKVRLLRNYEVMWLKKKFPSHWMRKNLPGKPSKNKKNSWNSFFCSQFLVAAFIHGNYILEDDESINFSPTALAEENTFTLKGYLGDCKMREYILNYDYFQTGGIL